MNRDRIPRRLSQLYVGLVLYGVSMAFTIKSSLGLDPWDVFHQGLANATGLRFGWIVNIVGAAVLLLWIPLRQRPGVGTISNVLVIGLAVDATLAVLPAAGPLYARAGFLVFGIVLNGVATGLYIGARLGPGPRDGLMTGFVALKPGRSIRLVRTAIEVTVLAIGWLLGGTVGLGTVLYAAAIGPLAHFLIPLLTVPPLPPPVSSSVSLPASPSVSSPASLPVSLPASSSVSPPASLPASLPASSSISPPASPPVSPSVSPPAFLPVSPPASPPLPRPLIMELAATWTA